MTQPPLYAVTPHARSQDRDGGGWRLRGALLAALSILALALAAAPAHAQSTTCAQTGQETVATDKADYPPESTVHMSGSGYAANCQVMVEVTRPDGSVVLGDGTGTPGSDFVDTGDDGSLSYDYLLQRLEGEYTVEVRGEEGTVLARTTFTDAFGISKLRVGTAAGTENYAYAPGDTIYADSDADNSKWYRFFLKDASGAVQSSTLCTATPILEASKVLTVPAAAAATTTNGWQVNLVQYTNATCATQDKTDSKYFTIARATAYTSSALTTTTTAYGTSGTAFIRLAGVGRVNKDSGVVGNAGDTNVTWIKPDTGTACANTGGGDRPDATANGNLPTDDTTKFLQYAPGATGDAWNLSASYDGACTPISASTAGQWKLRLNDDATHFVTVPVFSVDGTAPTSSASSPDYSNANPITVTYTASDTGGADVASVELFVDPPGGPATFVSAGVDNTPASPSFSYNAVGGNGTYRFYTRATDTAGNVEAAPGTEDDSTVVDTVKPASLASSPTYSTSNTFNVSYTASDATSGLDKVELYVNGPGAGGYVLAATDSTATAGEDIAFTASEGNGTYDFDTRAYDKAGNVEDAPGSADDSTVVDTVKPSSAASSPSFSTSNSFNVS